MLMLFVIYLGAVFANKRAEGILYTALPLLSLTKQVIFIGVLGRVRSLSVADALGMPRSGSLAGLVRPLTQLAVAIDGVVAHMMVYPNSARTNGRQLGPSLHINHFLIILTEMV